MRGFSSLGYVCLFLLTTGVCLPVMSADRREPLHSGMSERVTVSGQRLADVTQPVEQLPANVTIITAERIAESGARTLQDLLALEAGVVLYDQVGNDTQKTLDLRGFTAGTGTRVYLNGVPLNDTRNNAIRLDLIPLAALQRIEISRGAGGAIGGGGAEAGVINLVTRRGTTEGGAISLAAGSDDAKEVSAELSGMLGRLDYFLSAGGEENDGFRENAGGERKQFFAAIGRDFSESRRLALTVLDTDSELGNPGALTLDEYATAPEQSPFNNADFFNDHVTQATLNYRDTTVGAFDLAANLFFRDAESDSLSTGRIAAAGWGGFYLESAGETYGSTLQLSHHQQSGTMKNKLTAGVEWLEGEVDSLGSSTSASDPADLTTAFLSSDNRARRQTQAVFIQDSWSPTPAWTLLASVRGDRDQIRYTEDFPAKGSHDSRDFSNISFSGGVGWLPAERFDLYLNYGEGFLPPTAEQLFAFPTFGSNRDLDPQESSSVELGYRMRMARGRNLEIALFHVSTRNEIIFVPSSVPPSYGMNENFGKTRRQGLELSFRGELVDDVQAFATLTLTDAEIRSDDGFSGNRVPLVPRTRLTAGVDWRLGKKTKLRLDAQHVSDQVVANDEANLQPRLDSYTVMNGRLSFGSFFVSVTNILDEAYATRAISAFDFATSTPDEWFLTPAPGRRFIAGMDWTF